MVENIFRNIIWNNLPKNLEQCIEQSPLDVDAMEAMNGGGGDDEEPVKGSEGSLSSASSVMTESPSTMGINASSDSDVTPNYSIEKKVGAGGLVDTSSFARRLAHTGGPCAEENPQVSVSLSFEDANVAAPSTVSMVDRAGSFGNGGPEVNDLAAKKSGDEQQSTPATQDGSNEVESGDAGDETAQAIHTANTSSDMVDSVATSDGEAGGKTMATDENDGEKYDAETAAADEVKSPAEAKQSTTVVAGEVKPTNPLEQAFGDFVKFFIKKAEVSPLIP